MNIKLGVGMEMVVAIGATTRGRFCGCVDCAAGENELKGPARLIGAV